jgi:hypothetical protein
VSALGYTPAEIGTHSICSGAAMELVLSGHAAWQIMLAGRWKLSAFLVTSMNNRFREQQVQAFSRGVSNQIIENPAFFHVPDLDQLDGTSNQTTLASRLEANTINDSRGASPTTFKCSMSTSLVNKPCRTNPPLSQNDESANHSLAIREGAGSR